MRGLMRIVAFTSILGAFAPAIAQPLSAEHFAKDAEFQRVVISPDGDRLATTLRVDGRVLLNVLQLPSLKPIGTFGLRDGRDVEDIYWATNDRILFGLSYRSGDEEAPVFTGDLMAVNVDGSGVKTLLSSRSNIVSNVSISGRVWWILDVLRDDPDYVLIARYEYSKDYFPVVYRLNLKNGRLFHVLDARQRRADFLTDHEGKLRIQSGTELNDSWVIQYRGSEKSSWKEIGRYGGFGDNSVSFGGISPLEFDHDNKRVYAVDNLDSATKGLVLLDPENADDPPQLLFRHPIFDVNDLLPSRTRGQPIGVTWEGDRTEWRFFEPLHPDAALFEGIRQSFKGQDVHFKNFSWERNRAVFSVESDISPTLFYVIDLEHKKMLAKFPTRPWIDSSRMSPMLPLEMQARDDVTLRGYLTLPKERKKGALKKMVVLPHGGPHGVRDYWGFDPEVQWLAANGYAVLQVNYRGSSGYGKEFSALGHGEWGAKMQDDLTDATLWAIQNGFADQSAVCIYGGSYGGYASLMGVVREPNLYQCAVGFVGIYDLAMWKDYGAASSYAEGRAYQDAVIGQDEKTLRERSPAYRANEIKVPVLLIHGKDDYIAPIAQFDRMKDALEAAGNPPQTLLKTNEGHGFYGEENTAELYKTLVEFMDRSIGARH